MEPFDSHREKLVAALREGRVDTFNALRKSGIAQHDDPPTFSDLDLHGCALSGIDLSSCVLVNVDFSQCSMQGSDFSFARLDGCRFNHAFMAGCDFRNATVLPGGADFHRARLSTARFDEASIAYASFRGANLIAGSFTRARIDAPTTFQGADLGEAKFDHAVLVSRTDPLHWQRQFSDKRTGARNVSSVTRQGVTLTRATPHVPEPAEIRWPSRAIEERPGEKPVTPPEPAPAADPPPAVPAPEPPGMLARFLATLQEDFPEAMLHLGAEDLVDIVVDLLVKAAESANAPLDAATRAWVVDRLQRDEGKGAVGLLVAFGLQNGLLELLPLPPAFAGVCRGPFAKAMRLQAEVRLAKALRRLLLRELKAAVPLLGAALMKLATDERYKALAGRDPARTPIATPTPATADVPIR